MTNVGDIIPRGATAIPGDALAGVDRAGDLWVRNAHGHWHTQPLADPATCNDTPGSDCGNGERTILNMWLPFTVTAVRDPHPQPAADAPPLLDLVRQYGNAEYRDGSAGLDSESSATRELFDRIAALAPALPVQARDEDGDLLWLHGCTAIGYTRQGQPERCPDSCNNPGPWRPLLVGGDPAPEDMCPGMPLPVGDTVPRCGVFAAHEPHRIGDSITFRTFAGQPQPDLIAQVMAERDDWKRRFHEQADRGDADAQKRLTLMRERDEARAEVERLKSAARVVEMADAIAAKRREIGPIFLDVTAQPAHPRRTWPARPPVDDAPDDLRAVRVRGGEVYRRDPNNPDRWISPRGIAERWELLREVDLEEVTEPPVPQPAPRTAAGIWRAIGEDGRDQVRYCGGDASPGLELAEVLDREAGL